MDYLNYLSTTEIPLGTYTRKVKSAVEVSVMHFDYVFYYFLKKKGKKKVTIFFRLPHLGRAWFFAAPLPVDGTPIAEDFVNVIINRIANLKYEEDHINELSQG